MEDNTSILALKYKVFFIVSNETKNDNFINYSISKTNGIRNFQYILKRDNYLNTKFTVYVFYFDIYPQELSDKDKDIQTQKYKVKVNLKYNKTKFEKIILFSCDKNCFIYDLIFPKHKGWLDNKLPPEYYSFSKPQQFQLFYEAAIPIIL